MMYRFRYTFCHFHNVSDTIHIFWDVLKFWLVDRGHDPSTQPFSNGLRRRKTVETLKENFTKFTERSEVEELEVEAPRRSF